MLRVIILSLKETCARGSGSLHGRDSERARPEDESLVNKADADEHDAEPDEGERAQHAIEAGKVEKEDLEHGRHDEARRGEARLARTLPKPVAQKQDTEDEPSCRVGVKLTLREAFK